MGLLALLQSACASNGNGLQVGWWAAEKQPNKVDH